MGSNERGMKLVTMKQSLILRKRFAEPKIHYGDDRSPVLHAIDRASSG